MAIDKSISDQMLDPFRGMIKELQTRNFKGPQFDELIKIMQNMERHAAGMEDVFEFSTKMVTEGFYTDFSDKYTQVISSADPQQHKDGHSLD